MMKGILIVRKYKNRRLYDTERSVYVTREELMQIIREGRNVQIQDASTGMDVTNEQLLQMMAEVKEPLAIPAEFLQFLIRSNQNSLQQFFTQFLPMAMQGYQQYLAQMQNRQSQMNSFFGQMFPFGNPFQSWMNQTQNPSEPVPDEALSSKKPKKG